MSPPRTTNPLTPLAVLGLLIPLANSSACGNDIAPQDCTGAKCDVLVDFNDQLDGREDPIAVFLRTLDVDEQHQVEADYGTFAEGIAEQQGCGKESWRSFVISDAIVAGNAFPRVVSTVCSDEPTKASEFFIAASFKDPNEEDIDTKRLEMFAWDARAREYRFYASEDVGNGRIKIEVDPERCAGCHLTPQGLPNGAMRMTPIMNELTQPWSHWNSEIPMFSGRGLPFKSHDFEVPLEVREGADFVRYGSDRVGAAAELEAIIREGHDRVGLARSRDKRARTDDWRPAMDLMRPLFCEEQLNYATEDFTSGVIRVTALIPGGLREAYKAASNTGPWGWLNNDGEKIRLPLPNTAPGSEPPLIMIPTRGNADIGYENRLTTPLTTAVFTPEQIVQIRALDWKQPVLSEFRCGLWKDALARFESNPPEVSLGGRVSDIMKDLYPLILSLDGVAIDTGAGASFVALASADQASVAALRAALSADALPNSCSSDSEACVLDLDAFGEALDSYIQSLSDGDADALRSQLRAARDAKLCSLAKVFGAAPALPAFECEEPPAGQASFADSNDADVEITDNDEAGVTSTIEARADTALVANSVQVRVEVEHTWRGDLRIELSSPSGETQLVHAFESGDSEDGVNENFDVAGFSSTDDASGMWTLRVIDRAAQDTGTLLSWSLGINAAAP